MIEESDMIVIILLTYHVPFRAACIRLLLIVYLLSSLIASLIQYATHVSHVETAGCVASVYSLWVESKVIRK